MTLRWNGIIQRKLALMDQQLVRLEGHLRNVTLERFVADWTLRTISERTIQVCAEIMIDVAERIIAVAGVGPRPPPSRQSSASSKWVFCKAPSRIGRLFACVTSSFTVMTK